jgi:fatty acid desaturase
MLNKRIELGRFFGLEHTVLGSAILGLLLLWALLAAGAWYFLDQPPVTAAWLGLAAALLHFGGEVWHQYGHARAARRAGAPMSGVRYWWVLGSSRYPENEPEQPAAVHIRRALGGPVASLWLAAALALALLALPPATPVFYLTAFACAESLLVFGLGSFLPLGFTDGSTLLRYARK